MTSLGITQKELAQRPLEALKTFARMMNTLDTDCLAPILTNDSSVQLAVGLQ